MDGMADLSKILGIIMENPEIIEKIKAMAQTGEKDSLKTEATAEVIGDHTDKTEGTSESAETKTAEVSAAALRARDKKRRHDLLCAIKPYVSSERGRAIDTMLSVVEVFEIMKER